MNGAGKTRRSAILWLLVIILVPCFLCSGSAWLIAGLDWAYTVLAAFAGLCIVGAMSGAVTWLIMRSRQ